jgi:large subunit ribosomal protein L21
MYAIVDIAGQQFKVKQGQQIYVHRLEAEEGSNLSIDKVLMIDNEGMVKVGTPLLSGAQVDLKVIEHMKGDKVLVFKKKRRKGYQKMNGHRQYLSKVIIENIIG